MVVITRVNDEGFSRMAKKIGKIHKIPLRELWRSESRNFTPFLSKNLDLLSDALGFELHLIQKEVPAGTFKLDILAEGEQSEKVVIENQYGSSDHDHLGKILIYANAFDAKKAIWICEESRQEHVDVIDWFNKFFKDECSFYYVKVEMIKIDDSIPAPIFTVIAEPSLISPPPIVAKSEGLRKQFWTELLNISKVTTPLFSGVSPKTDHWLGTGAGKTGFWFNYIILMNSTRIELQIHTSESEKNKQYFDAILKEKEKIESEFGDSLSWQRKDDQISSYLRYPLNIKSGLMDEDKWPALQEAMIEKMIQLDNILRPIILNL